MAPRQRANLRERFRHYANASHTAIATRPASASEMRYAVISLSVNQMCGMIAARNHFRREPYPSTGGAACGGGLMAAPRAGAFARAGKTNAQRVRTAARLRRSGRVRGRMWRRDARAAVRYAYSMKKPAADFSARALEDFAMMPLCQ